MISVECQKLVEQSFLYFHLKNYRLPSPQRGRGAGGEGKRTLVIGRR